MGLLSSLGGLVRLAVGGPVGAAIGSGVGALASGGDLGDALKSGILGYGIGSIPGVQNMVSQAAGAIGMGGMASSAAPAAAGGGGLFGGGAGGFGGLFGGGAGQAAAAQGAAQGAAGAGAASAARAAQGGGIGNLLGNIAGSPLVMASLLEAAQPRGPIATPLQQRQMATGERLPDYRGTAAPDYRYNGMNMAQPGVQMRAEGGYIEGPGTGKSDSIPAMIYQNGGPVQEARLSDGEFVMTADAVRGAGNGDRAKGAAKMYEMMNRLERRA